jgi:hypothetical protein
MSLVSTRNNSGKGRKLDEKKISPKQLDKGIKLDDKRKKNLTHLSARSATTNTCPSLRSKYEEFCPCLHLQFLCRLGSTPQTRHCDCDEMSQYTKQLRQGKKTKRQNEKKNLTNLSARTIALLRLLQRPANEFFRCDTQLQSCLP